MTDQILTKRIEVLQVQRELKIKNHELQLLQLDEQIAELQAQNQ